MSNELGSKENPVFLENDESNRKIHGRKRIFNKENSNTACKNFANLQEQIQFFSLFLCLILYVVYF